MSVLSEGSGMYDEAVGPGDAGMIHHALRSALKNLDAEGRATVEAAALFRIAWQTGYLSNAWRQDAAELLGDFGVLGEEGRNAIRQAIAEDDLWRMRGYGMGQWHTAVARSLWSLRRAASGRRLRRLSNVAEILAVAVQSGPARGLYALHRQFLKCEAMFGSRPGMGALLSRAGIEARELAIGYAKGVPQPPAFRGYWHDRGRHITYSVVIGFDLLLTEMGCWYVEGNLNFGMSDTRVSLYTRDPFVDNLLDFASGQGYRTVVFVNNLSSNMNRSMAAQLEGGAKERGLRVRIIEDAHVPGSGYARSFTVPEVDERDTLVVRTKGYRTSLDNLFDNKRASQRALELYQTAADESELHLPASGAEPVLGRTGEDEPFPNLVYKFPERDAGKGIAFIKAASPEHAKKIIKEATGLCRPSGFTDLLYSFVDDRKGIFQSYIHSPLREGRFLSKIRSHVLLSPAGCRFLSGHRVVSRYPVPERLPLGLVQDDRPYLVNLSRSSAYEVLTPSEEESVAAATLAIARGLSWAVEQGFETGDDPVSVIQEEKGGKLP